MVGHKIEEVQEKELENNSLRPQVSVTGHLLWQTRNYSVVMVDNEKKEKIITGDIVKWADGSGRWKIEMLPYSSSLFLVFNFTIKQSPPLF